MSTSKPIHRSASSTPSSLTSPTVPCCTASRGSVDAQWCLEQYYAELDTRFVHGLDRGTVQSTDVDEISPPNGLFVVVRLDGHPVGCGALKRSDPAVIDIKRMWLRSDMRGRGLDARCSAISWTRPGRWVSTGFSSIPTRRSSRRSRSTSRPVSLPSSDSTTTRTPPASSNEHSIDPAALRSEARIMNPPSAVIFDFDGTIADTETPVYEAARIAHEEHGLELPMATWIQVVGTAYNKPLAERLRDESAAPRMPT